MRTPLPARRPSLNLTASWRGIEFDITLGIHPRTGDVLDVFVDLSKGGDIAAVARDAAVQTSLGLQYGVPPEVMLKSMQRVPEWRLVDGEMVEGEGWASPIGAIVEAIVKETGE